MGTLRDAPRRIMGRAAAAAALLALTALASGQPPEEEAGAPATLPEPLVYLRDIDPSILQDIRYAGQDNFTGRRIPGYAAGECVLLREAAAALARVQRK